MSLKKMEACMTVFKQEEHCNEIEPERIIKKTYFLTTACLL